MKRTWLAVLGLACSASLHAQVKVNALPSGSTPSSGDYTICDQSGTTNKCTMSQLATFFQSDLSFGVTSVGLSDGSTTPIFTISGNPVTATGTLTETLTTQSANTVFAGPASGGAAQPGFRTLVANDLTSALASPPNIGGTTPAGVITAVDGVFTSMISSAINGPIGTVTPSTGVFTTLSASSTVSGTGFSTYLASPPAIGGTTPSTINATSYSTSGVLNPYILVQSGIAFVVPSSGTIGNNGALSAITALPRTISTGAYFYFPSGAIASGSSAGWYWTVMSSTTAGTIYNSTYTSGQPEVGTTTAFSTTGPGAYTQTTGVLSSAGIGGISVPGNTLGANGRIETMWLLSMSSSGSSAKFCYMNYGGTNMGELQTSNAITAAGGYYTMTNRGVTNGQVVLANINGSESGDFGTGSVNIRTVDSTQAQTYQIYLGITTAASDFVILESFSTKIFPHT